MKKLGALLICLFIANSVLGQDAAKAKQLLDDVSKKVKSYDNISLDFKYVLNNTEEDIKQETTGNVVLQGEKYLLNFMGITKLFDLKKEYTIVPENEEITIAEPEDSEAGVITPSKMLTFYEDGYNYSWDIVQNIKGRKIQFIKLTPMDSSAEISQILLGIDVQTKHIYSLIQSDGSSTTTTFTVNSFKTNRPLSKSLFTFDPSKYKDYYINN
ncbi:LolA family protein [Spongiivirga citrea]|uniref:Outer membrane lipoprotein carrier protein LolA n=1 Tax=Spongiivirga citrea TaxID=1481457 RepID=A0A6M0CSB3_9FLAO|nr:outer membrane lipoprotein carrier protein LolA [Spongiivirga citrea]NER16760.1 outer membrane lipoprotein carrier protein LolA [Spongiivirga citrea]